MAVLDDDELRRLIAALRDGEEATHLLAPQRRIIEDLYLERRDALCHRPRALGEVSGRAHVRRQVRKIALHAHRIRDRRAVDQAASRGSRTRFANGAYKYGRKRRRLGLFAA